MTMVPMNAAIMNNISGSASKLPGEDSPSTSLRVRISGEAVCVAGRRTLRPFRKAFINAHIIEKDGEDELMNEGCLSIPEYVEKVKRATKIKVRAQDRTGKPFEIDAEGLLAKALQHEIDHLNGLLYIDRLSPLKKNIFKRRYKRLLTEKA